jgi:C4-dicarboxylate transporter
MFILIYLKETRQFLFDFKNIFMFILSEIITNTLLEQSYSSTKDTLIDIIEYKDYLRWG